MSKSAAYINNLHSIKTLYIWYHMTILEHLNHTSIKPFIQVNFIMTKEMRSQRHFYFFHFLIGHYSNYLDSFQSSHFYISKIFYLFLKTFCIQFCIWNSFTNPKYVAVFIAVKYLEVLQAHVCMTLNIQIYVPWSIQVGTQFCIRFTLLSEKYTHLT